jgi:hypothetical protein
MEIRDINLVERLCPEEWKHYCEVAWGTPEELQAMEDQRLNSGGIIRSEDTVEGAEPKA